MFSKSRGKIAAVLAICLPVLVAGMAQPSSADSGRYLLEVTANTSAERTQIAQIGVDTPLPYRTSDLIGILEEYIGKLELRGELLDALDNPLLSPDEKLAYRAAVRSDRAGEVHLGLDGRIADARREGGVDRAACGATRGSRRRSARIRISNWSGSGSTACPKDRRSSPPPW